MCDKFRLAKQFSRKKLQAGIDFFQMFFRLLGFFIKLFHAESLNFLFFSRRFSEVAFSFEFSKTLLF